MRGILDRPGVCAVQKEQSHCFITTCGCVDDDDELSEIDPNYAPFAARSGAWLKDKFFFNMNAVL